MERRVLLEVSVALIQHIRKTYEEAVSEGVLVGGCCDDNVGDHVAVLVNVVIVVSSTLVHYSDAITDQCVTINQDCVIFNEDSSSVISLDVYESLCANSYMCSTYCPRTDDYRRASRDMRTSSPAVRLRAASSALSTTLRRRTRVLLSPAYARIIV